jgi:hypothetical protein
MEYVTVIMLVNPPIMHFFGQKLGEGAGQSPISLPLEHPLSTFLANYQGRGHDIGGGEYWHDYSIWIKLYDSQEELIYSIILTKIMRYVTCNTIITAV